MNTMPDNLHLTVRAALDADLRRAGITQEELGRRLGITQGAIGNWVADNAVPSSRTTQLAEILGAESVLVQELARRRHQEAYDVAQLVGKQRRLKFPSGESANFDLVGESALSFAPPPPRPDFAAHTSEAEFFEALPEELKRFAQMPRGDVDYVGLRAAAEITVLLSANSLRTRLASHVMRLAVLAKREPSAAGRRHLLFLIRPAHPSTVSDDLQLNRLIADADLLGVTVVPVTNGRRAAEIVTAVESGQIDEAAL